MYISRYIPWYISWNISCYKHWYLGILSSKTMFWQIKWIATCLWPAPVIFTLPLKSCPCPQMTPILVRHKDSCKDSVEFFNCPATTLLGWNGKFLLHVFGEPLSEL